MDSILHIIQNYYGGIIGTGVSFSAIYKLIKNWFQKYVVTNMLILQKDTTLTDQQKFVKLTTDIYNGLPLAIRLVLTQNSFAQLSQAIYDRIFPKKTNDTPVVDPNAEIKNAIVSVVSDAIISIDKNTDVKIEEMTKQLQQEKSDELNKIVDTLKQNLLVGNDNNNTKEESQTS